jgi:hypothetical protein
MTALFLARSWELYDHKGKRDPTSARSSVWRQGYQQGRVGEAIALLMFEVDPGQKIFHSAPNFDSTGPRFFDGPQPLFATKTGRNRSKLSIFLQNL